MILKIGSLAFDKNLSTALNTGYNLLTGHKQPLYTFAAKRTLRICNVQMYLKKYILILCLNFISKTKFCSFSFFGKNLNFLASLHQVDYSQKNSVLTDISTVQIQMQGETSDFHIKF